MLEVYTEPGAQPDKSSKSEPESHTAYQTLSPQPKYDAEAPVTTSSVPRTQSNPTLQ